MFESITLRIIKMDHFVEDVMMSVTCSPGVPTTLDVSCLYGYSQMCFSWLALAHHASSILDEALYVNNQKS